jgi:nitroreductase
MDDLSFFDVVYTARAIRHLRPDPVPPALVHRVLEAATMAPSATNVQPWRFIVVADPAIKQRLGEIHTRAFWARYGSAGPQLGGASETERRPQEPQGISEREMADRFAQAPVLIVVCRTGMRPSGSMGLVAWYGSIFPAVQNLLLAARALGLGTTLTTMFVEHEHEVKDLLDMPDDAEPIALIPLGFPEGRFGPLRRRPVVESIYSDRWGRRANSTGERAE